MKTVISASRRTDIPAFYLPWFIDCLKQGYADIIIPRGLPKRVDLQPDAVHSIVLWSKNFRPFLKRRSEFKKYRLYFQFTVNDCAVLEPRVPGLPERLEQVRELADIFGPEYIHWRFDPIIFWDEGRASNMGHFCDIAQKMFSSGIRRCTFSFCTHYRKTVNQTRRKGLILFDPPLEEKRRIAEELGRITQSLGITLYACSQPGLSGIKHVSVAKCIDGNLLEQLFGERASRARDRSQREECHCTKSVDVGSYNLKCLHGCSYCYANPGILA